MVKNILRYNFHQMGHIIKPNSAGKTRNQLERGVVLALRELLHQTEAGVPARDMAAFIALALTAIAGTIDESVTAWEKRGYWLKADRFRLDWEWSGRAGNAMRQALVNDDWGSVARVAVEVTNRLKNVHVPERHRLGTPWVGAWNELNRKSGNKSSF